jgi:predicted choloylglycine hydrolase
MTGAEGKSVKPDVSFCLALRCVLDKYSSVDEAAKLLSNTHLSTSHNYLLADREGNLAVVEASPIRQECVDPRTATASWSALTILFTQKCRTWKT